MSRKVIGKALKWIGVAVLVYLLYMVYLTFKPVRLQELSLVSLTGRAMDPDSLFRDKLTILNFWATWCKPCLAEMPMLDSVYQSLDKEKWQILLISDESADKINAFHTRVPYAMPFLKSDKPFSEIGIAALPKTVIIDEERKVLYTKTGGLTMGADGMRKMLGKYALD